MSEKNIAINTENKKMIETLKKEHYFCKINKKKNLLIMKKGVFTSVFHFNTPTVKELFNFGDTKIFEKVNTFTEILNKFPSDYFKYCKKIFLVESKKDFCKMFFRYPLYMPFVKKLQGVYMKTNGNVIINISEIKKFVSANYTCEEYEDKLTFFFIETLLHELTHAKRENPLNKYDKDERKEQSVLKEGMLLATTIERYCYNSHFPLLFSTK